MMALALVCACGPTRAAEDDGDADDTGSSTDTSTSTDPGSSATSLDTGGTSSSDSSSEASSTGETFTFSGDEVWWERMCGEDGATAWIELYPGQADGECAPPPDISDNFVLILLQPWDGQGGTFVIDEDGPSRASIGTQFERPVGEVTIEVSAPWQLSTAIVDLATPTASVSGTVDLSECGTSQIGDPCR